ncbi:MAG: PAS domain-containing sensor histidine kinase [Gammaproteobacteria bacterium]|nr:PAS domain-containing sensor histidine kinase [Gammaproteobacteria bacterium]
MTTLIPCQNIIDNLTTCVVILDDNLNVKFINASAEILFDISQRQAELIPFRVLLPGEQGLFESLSRVQQTGQALIKRELKLYIPSNGDVLVDCAIKLLELGDKSPYVLLEFSQLDFKDRISRDESLHAQQQVVRGLAHEIKNPLGGLRGAAQLLERQLESVELREYTSIIISEADRLQNLMTNMLGPHQQSKQSLVNIHEVLQRVRQLVFAEIDEKLVFISDYDPSIPAFYADFDQLVQVFLNIVRNAVQAMRGIGNIIVRTRIQRYVTIENQHHKLALAVEIEDNGPGIPPSLQESMFYPLVTGRAEGTGLGLYLSQNLIHRNHGAISCISRPGQTVFTVVFPLERVCEK